MDLSDIRKKIDDIDSKLLPLFLERMNISAEVAEYKKANGLPVLNKQRERDILKWVRAESGDMELYSDRLYNTIFELSRSYQDSILADTSRLSQEIEAGL
ncbi:MAG: chorismate mutase, partial [Clostridia bacterium]|nr:chorismate mutase [Clostridia bacterium]